MPNQRDPNKAFAGAWITKEERRLAQKIARQQGKSLSDVLKEFIARYLDQEQRRKEGK